MTNIPPTINPQPGLPPIVTPPPIAPGISTTSPIADLSYRTYSGPVRKHFLRWWIVALYTFRRARRSPWFWILTGFSVISYLFHMLIYYFNSAIGQTSGTTSAIGTSGTIPGTFFSAMNGNLNSYCLMGIALLLGAGSIAADTRANALIIYLSRSITRSDYLLGKWFGQFLALYMVAVAPALLMFVIFALAYTSQGFFVHNPWLIVHILLAALAPTVLLSSLVTGISAWSKSSFASGAIFFSLYFISGVLSNIIGIAIYHHSPDTMNLVRHFSISGLIDALSQRIYNIPLTNPFSRNGFGRVILPILFRYTLPPVVILSLFSLLMARIRIKAVEVVSG